MYVIVILLTRRRGNGGFTVHYIGVTGLKKTGKLSFVNLALWEFFLKIHVASISLINWQHKSSLKTVTIL